MSDRNIDNQREIGILKQNNGAASSQLQRHMLIVDDSKIDQALLANIFSDSFIIERANDGTSALSLLHQYKSELSIVLLNLVMPDMSGIDVLKKMQDSSELQNIPVIIVSADKSREASLDAIRAGAVDFVNKPVDTELLRVHVDSVIKRFSEHKH